MIGALNLKINKIQAEHFEIYQQAKEMEKQQIVDAHIEGQRVFDNYQHTQWTTDQAEEYYKETFKSE